MSEFTYFICLESNIDLLKTEIGLFAPQLKLSFSKKNFLTYKGKPNKEQQFAFALEWGESSDISKEYIQKKVEHCTKLPLLPDHAPSRAYLKILQACEKFHVTNSSLNWIEFGCSPGGAIDYLARNFHTVVGIDPAEIDPQIKVHKNFVHIKKPIQNLDETDLKKHPCDYFTSDLNLNPKQAISEVLRCSRFFPKLRGIFMTVKIVKIEHIQHIPKFENSFKKFGFHSIEKVQLSSHKREFLLFARKT